MPPLSLTRKHIDQACTMRAYGGSDGACARHAGVAPTTFFTWLHYGEIIADYLENGNELLPKEHYRTWMSSATVMLAKVQRELEMTGGSLSKEHKLYLKLWNGMRDATDDFVQQCQMTIDKAKNSDPAWALKAIRWFHPEEYREPGEAAQAMTELANRESASTGEEYELPIRTIAPSFLDVYDDITARLHTEYVLYGGRGSTKSTFVSLVFIYLIKKYPNIHLLAMRQVKDTLRDSVYSQIKWAINELGFSDEFKCTTSPVEITYLPTGQKIYFRGADDAGKLKSIKPAFGYIGALWFEELDQYYGDAEIRKIEQSVIRGGDVAFIFKTFNPPPTANNWANKYVKIPKETQLLHKSTYLDLGGRIRWLGKVFVDEAEHLKAINPKAYDHEYMGNPSSAGGAIFENVTIREITDEEISTFERVYHGLDFGYYPDPAHYARCAYNASQLTLYIYGEVRHWKASNRKMYDEMVECGLQPNDMLICDSAEPKSIADLVSYGSTARGAEKGPDSLNYSMKWLQSLKEIVIDKKRCPATADEFLDYEFEKTKDGEIISAYPDKNDHAIAAVRYALNLYWRQRGK